MSPILFEKLIAKVTFYVFSGSPQSIFPYSHMLERLNWQELNFRLMVNQARTYRRFTTANINNIVISIAKLVYTFARRGILNICIGKGISLTKWHFDTPFMASIGI